MATRTCNDDSMWPVILRKLVRARLFYLNKKKDENKQELPKTLIATAVAPRSPILIEGLYNSDDQVLIESLRDNPNFGFFNECYWKIVSQPTLASGSIAPLIWKGPSVEIQWKDYVPTEPSFTSFPKLPVELRLKIWKFALPEPRVVIFDVMTLFVSKAKFGGLLSGNAQNFGKAHLLTCHESRQLFLENYHDIKDYVTPAVGQFQRTLTDAYKAYLNPRRDTLIVDIKSLHSLEGKICFFDFSQVKHLALSGAKCLQSLEFSVPMNFNISPALRSLILVRGSVHEATAQLTQTEEYHLVDVYHDLRYMEEHRPLKENQSATRDIALGAYIRITKKHFPKEFNLKYFGAPASAEFRVSFIAGRFKGDGWNERKQYEKVWLAPRSKKPLDVTFYTKEPSTPTDCQLHIPAMAMVGRCSEDGTLFTIYDGIKELFDGGGD